MRARLLLTLCLALGVLLPRAPAGPARAAGTFAAFASPRFAQVWARADQPVAAGAVARSWLWGPGPGAVQAEPFAGGTRTVQYFDKARMEVNPAVSDPASPWATTTGLLVVELVSGQLQTGPASFAARAPADVPVAGDDDPAPDLAPGVPRYNSFGAVASLPGGPDRRVPAAPGAPVVATIDRAGTIGALPASDVHYSTFTAETGHNIPDVFARFMASRGLVEENGTLAQGALFDPVYVLGYPISEAYWATVPVAGKPLRVLIQLYQRRVLTYIPDYAPAWQVQMGNVGQHYYAWRYTQPAAAANPPTAIPNAQLPTPNPSSPTPDPWVRIAGSQFVAGGRPVVLKGTNFWLHLHAFVGTWTAWDGPVAQQELEKAHELGVNTVRIGVPYDNPYSDTIVWGPGCDKGRSPCTQINGPLTNEMTQLLQIAAGYNMKVIFTLFEWSDKFPAAGTVEYTRQLNYLQGIVAPFANDDRVIGWDLHNEPENYAPWNGDPAGVLAWVANIAGAVRALDPHHPVTVGVGNYADLWREAGGRRLIDLVDFASFHCYDAGGLRTQIDAIAAHTGKPILLEEMGWPTGPAKLSTPAAVYDEATQEFLYRSMLGDAKASPLVGVIQWMLQDTPIGTLTHYIPPSPEQWFGLVRRAGSWKPAAADFRDSYPAPPLPSSTVTTLPLTAGPP